IGEALLLMLERMKLLAEGAGAAALAGAIEIAEEVRGQRDVVVIRGGHIDNTLLGRVKRHGQAEAGRRLRIDIILGVRTGGQGRRGGWPTRAAKPGPTCARSITIALGVTSRSARPTLCWSWKRAVPTTSRRSTRIFAAAATKSPKRTERRPRSPGPVVPAQG